MSEESLIEDLLDEYEDARQRGDFIDVEQFCRDYPQVAVEFRRRVDILRQMDKKLAGISDDKDSTELEFQTEISELKFHAKGGLGAVYVGKDRRLNRHVAVKFIHRERAKDLVSRQYFELEAEVTGRLEHPGVIPMYGIGQSACGRQFYTMRFIDGQTLDESIRRFYSHSSHSNRESKLLFRSLLLAFASVCKTIAYAHNRGIVHRDIKPDNVMLGRYGETIVVDWGLAMPVAREERFRVSGELTLLPQSGSNPHASDNAAGTPAYMCPEQASNLSATPAGDIYSLGGTLFKILTGRPPVTGATLDEVRTKILEGRIPRPSELNPRVDRAMDAICGKAMALQPNQRYATALELAYEIENYLADESVAAYQESSAEKVARFFRHHRAASMVAVAGLSLSLLLAGLASLWLASANSRERRAHLVAEQSRRENLSTSSMFLAKSVAYEIELYWRILESEAESSRLRELLNHANEQIRIQSAETKEAFQPLQSWLEKRYIATGTSVKTLSWCIYSVDGTQVARVPEAPSIGQNFAHRDYFHGKGRDLTKGTVSALEPILPLVGQDAYASAVYLGSNTQTLLITFSVPIWSGPRDETDRKRIGVLAFPVELGEFSLGSHAVLADTRPDQLRGSAGLILNHPNLGPRSLSDTIPYLSVADLERVKQLAVDRQAGEMLNLPRTNIVEAFRDPVDGKTRLSEIEPVIIRGRKNSSPDAIENPGSSEGDTGWVVIAMEDN